MEYIHRKYFFNQFSEVNIDVTDKIHSYIFILCSFVRP